MCLSSGTPAPRRLAPEDCTVESGDSMMHQGMATPQHVQGTGCSTSRLSLGGQHFLMTLTGECLLEMAVRGFQGHLPVSISALEPSHVCTEPVIKDSAGLPNLPCLKTGMIWMENREEGGLWTAATPCPHPTAADVMRSAWGAWPAPEPTLVGVMSLGAWRQKTLVDGKQLPWQPRNTRVMSGGATGAAPGIKGQSGPGAST